MHVAADHIAGAVSHGEAVAAPALLVYRLTDGGTPEGLPDDRDLSELARASIADVAGIPILELAIGRLAGCAFPDFEHHCTKNRTQCACSLWHGQLFNQLDDGD